MRALEHQEEPRLESLPAAGPEQLELLVHLCEREDLLLALQLILYCLLQLAELPRATGLQMVLNGAHNRISWSLTAKHMLYFRAEE